MKKVIFCLFGVICRSIKYTFESINKNILEELRQNNYNVEIYVFNLNIKDNLIDGVKIDNNDVNIIPYNYFEEYDQDELDKMIENIKNEKKETFTRGDYTEGTIQNCFRQMYSEYRVGMFLENNIDKYDIAIVCGPDFYIANKINLKELEDSYINKNIYISITNDAQGYSNGFYFGVPSSLIKPLKRYEYVSNYFPNPRDYEYILQRSVDDNNIKREITSLYFLKIRANKNIFFRSNNDKYKSVFSNSEFDKILERYNNLIKELNNM